MWSKKSVSDITGNTEESDLLDMSEEIIASQDTVLDVRINKDTIIPMKLDKLDQLTDEALKEGKYTVASIQDLVSETIKSANDKFLEEKNQKDNELKNIEAKQKSSDEALAKALKDQEALTLSLKETKESLERLLQEVKASKEAEDFSTRMSYFDNKFTLEEREREIVGSKIKNLNEDDFNKVRGELEVLLASKIKKTKEEVKASEDNAQKTVDDALTNSKKDAIVDTKIVASETFLEKFKKLGGNGDRIWKGWKFADQGVYFFEESEQISQNKLYQNFILL
jgi:hypothetical protein